MFVYSIERVFCQNNRKFLVCYFNSISKGTGRAALYAQPFLLLLRCFAKRKLFFIVEVLAVSVFFWGYTYDLLKCSGKVVGILITEAGCNFIDGSLSGSEKAACTLHF